MLEDGIEQRQHVRVAVIGLKPRVAVHGARVDGGEVKLLVTCAQLEHELEDFVEHLVGTRAGTVDLVDDDNGD